MTVSQIMPCFCDGGEISIIWQIINHQNITSKRAEFPTIKSVINLSFSRSFWKITIVPGIFAGEWHLLISRMSAEPNRESSERGMWFGTKIGGINETKTNAI
jgi:hypothetical protein